MNAKKEKESSGKSKFNSWLNTIGIVSEIPKRLSACPFSRAFGAEQKHGSPSAKAYNKRATSALHRLAVIV